MDRDSETFVILDAGERHIEALEKLEKQCFSVPWTEEQLRAWLPDEMHVFLIAVEQEKLLGYVGMMHVLDEGYISNVAVAPEARRRGVASALIRKLLSRAEADKLSFVTLEVRESNAAAIALYERLGFRSVGRRKQYYDTPKEDALLMTCFLK